MNIEVNGAILANLLGYKHKCQKEAGGIEVSWEFVIGKLIKLLYQNLKLTSKLNGLSSKVEKKETEIESLKGNIEKLEMYLKMSLSQSSSTPVIMSDPRGMSLDKPYYPTPPPLTAPPPLKLPKIEADAEVKDAFGKECSAVFDGHIRKPSEIIAMTKPKHAESEVKEFDGKKPSLLETSHCLKNTEKFKKEAKL